MISYREKQMLMVMKMMQDETTELTDVLSHSIEEANSGKPLTQKVSFHKTPIENYSALVEIAEERGYNTYIRASDILSPEELANIESRKDEIENQFKKLVKLQKGDYVFLFSAVALLLAKQIFIKLDLSKREDSADDTDKEYEDKYDNPDEIDGKEKAKRYYAPTQQIKNTKTVPFDFVANTKRFNHGTKPTGLGLDGDNHRFKSVGHDPLLGLAFGTANILTNTATFYVDKKVMASFHIKYEDMSKYKGPYISSYASTNLMFKKVYDRAKNEPNALVDAFVKEIDHIKSDKDSVAGIPLPFLAYILGDEKARELALKGFDLNTFLKNSKIVGEQALFSVFINLIITWLHRLYILWDDLKETDSLLEAAKVYLTTKMSSFDTVRTKKIIMYANTIASTINLGVCIGGGIISAKIGDPELSKEFFSHLDIGGLMVTIATLFKDGKYILKVKDDFIKEAIDRDFCIRLEQIESELSTQEML